MVTNVEADEDGGSDVFAALSFSMIRNHKGMGLTHALLLCLSPLSSFVTLKVGRGLRRWETLRCARSRSNRWAS
jgi:hypothetical protein